MTFSSNEDPAKSKAKIRHNKRQRELYQKRKKARKAQQAEQAKAAAKVTGANTTPPRKAGQ